MSGTTPQIANHQPHRRAGTTNHNEECPERFHKDMRQRRTLRQRRLVHPEIGEPEHLQHSRHNSRAVNTGKPQQMADQYRQQDRRERICSRHQWFENGHNGLRDQHVKLRLYHQA